MLYFCVLYGVLVDLPLQCSALCTYCTYGVQSTYCIKQVRSRARRKQTLQGGELRALDRKPARAGEANKNLVINVIGWHTMHDQTGESARAQLPRLCRMQSQ